MINVTEIINFDRTQDELEELLLFSVATAGKDAKNTANAIGKFLRRNQQVKESPFQCIERILGTRGPKALATRLQRAGVGCFNQRARSFRDIIVKGIDPKTCSLEQLDLVPDGMTPAEFDFEIWKKASGND